MERDAQLKALAEAAQSGDIRAKRAAVRALVDALGGEVLGYLIQRTRCRATAEDLTQRTFLKVLLNIDKLQHTASLRYWVLTIARHQLLDHARKHKRAPSVELDEALSDPNAKTPERLLIERQRRDHANTITRALTERQRQVITLAAEGRSNLEIADALGIRPGTVGALKFKALKRARALVLELEHGGL